MLHLTPLIGSLALMGAHMSWNTCVAAVLEITAGHWPFYDQSQHLANQNFEDFQA